MDFTFERKVNYYETDRMGVVHHSNYIRFLEEARCFYFDKIGMPFSNFEANNVTIPVLSVNCTYKQHVTFDDTLLINVFVKDYTGVRFTVSYDVKNKSTGDTVIIAETKHCFTDKNLKPINLKKVLPKYSEAFQELNDNFRKDSAFQK